MLIGFFISLSVAQAGVLKTGLTLAHDMDSTASLSVTVSKDLGDNLVFGNSVIFRLETEDGKPLIPGGSFQSGSASFYNSFNGMANVYVLNLELYDKKVLDVDSAARTHFFVNLKKSKLVFYKYENGGVGAVAGVMELAPVCEGSVLNLSGADKCNISQEQVLGGQKGKCESK